MARYSICYATWDQLPPGFRDDLARIVGGDLEEAEDFYRLYFYWYNVAHELGHILRGHLGTDTYRHGEYWREEQEVNDFAVALWRHAGCERRLERVAGYAERALSGLPDPVPPGMDPKAYFDANIEVLVPRPPVYAFFQFTFVRRSLAQPLEFLPTLRKCIWPDAVESDLAAELNHPELHEDLPREIVGDLLPFLNGYGVATPAVDAVKTFSPRLNYVVRHE